MTANTMARKAMKASSLAHRRFTLATHVGYHIRRGRRWDPPSVQLVASGHSPYSVASGHDVEFVAFGIRERHPLKARLVIVTDAPRAERDHALDIGHPIAR